MFVNRRPGKAEWVIGDDEFSILMRPDGKIVDREKETMDDDDDESDAHGSDQNEG